METKILDCVPAGYDLRTTQDQYFKWLEANWDHFDVAIVGAPTAAGKSLMNITTSRWCVANAQTAALMAPRKFLQDQYTGEFPDMPFLKGMSAYTCDDCLYRGQSCKAVKSVMGRVCGQQCKYIMARNYASMAPACLFNFHSYFVNKMYKNVAIVDEGHGAVDLLYGLFGRKLWQCETNYPDDIEETPEAIAAHVSEIIDNLESRLSMLVNQRVADDMIESMQEEIENFSMLHEALTTCGDDFLIKKKTGPYWGQVKNFRKTEQPYLYVKTMRIDKLAEKILWPRDKVSKIILTSATIGPEDVALLGLDQNRRVMYYECPSLIPPDNRMFISDPVASMTYRNRQESYPKIVKKIKELAERHKGQKGVVHCTYDVAKELKARLGDTGRYMFHTQSDKDVVLASFMAHSRDPILVCSGMAEGIDLKGDLARWQVITMLQFPSLDDEVMKWLANTHPRRYKWMAIRNLIQQTGRIVRGPDDWGCTYFVGSELNKDFYNDTIELWPKWFRDAMVWL